MTGILSSAVAGKVELVLLLLPRHSRWKGDGVGDPCLGCLAKLCSPKFAFPRVSDPRTRVSSQLLIDQNFILCLSQTLKHPRGEAKKVLGSGHQSLPEISV